MNCFELVKEVLDEEYSQLEGNEDAKDKKIRKALQQLSSHYSSLSNNGPGDYSDGATRFAYIYRYTTAHSNLVYSKISTSHALKKLFSKSSVEVACIGGGPGSDYLGILKYLLLNNKKPKLRCSLFDREAAWIESWSDVDKKVESEIQLSLQFITIDVTEDKSWKPHKKYYNSDLFTLVYFMSEVVKHEVEADSYFETLFSSAKSGAYFLFIDNNSNKHYSWFDRLAKKYKLKSINSQEQKEQMPVDEEKKSLGKYYSKFDSPKLVADIAYRLAQKVN